MSTPTDPNGPDGEYLTGRANVRSDPGRASLLMHWSSPQALSQSGPECPIEHRDVDREQRFHLPELLPHSPSSFPLNLRLDSSLTGKEPG